MSDTDDTESVNNTYVNDLTLNFLMNKSHHKKYISKTNPEEHKREQKYQSSLRKYKGKIMNITEELIKNPDTQVTTDVNEIFIGYTKTLIRYFKMKEIENKEFYNDSDEDMLFGNMNESEDENVEKEDSSEIMSFWGTKILKKNK